MCTFGCSVLETSVVSKLLGSAASKLGSPVMGVWQMSHSNVMDRHAEETRNRKLRRSHALEI